MRHKQKTDSVPTDEIDGFAGWRMKNREGRGKLQDDLWVLRKCDVFEVPGFSTHFHPS